MDVNGTLVWYYNICKRQVWLMSRYIVPDQNDENIDLGRFIHEQAYIRNEKEISFGNVKFDVLFRKGKEITIGETKKTSRYEEASKWQLMYYLKVLRECGINAKGLLLYPEEKKRVEVLLDEESEAALNQMVDSIEGIIGNEIPPEVVKIHFCKNCAYRDYCYA